MNIDLAMVPTLWYENEKGERHVPTVKEIETCANPPDGFVYQHSQFPNMLRHTGLRNVVLAEVNACEHPSEDVHKTYGWIDGIDGRECKRCHGSQTRKAGEAWPTTWNANGSREAFCGNSSWPEDLVLAMARPRWPRWAWSQKTYMLGEAILIAANACERCLNVLGYRYGLAWGYAEGSDEWEKSGTRCQFCETKEG